MQKSQQQKLSQLFTALKQAPGANHDLIQSLKENSSFISFENKSLASTFADLYANDKVALDFLQNDLFLQQGFEFVYGPRYFIGHGFSKESGREPRSDLYLKGLFQSEDNFAFLIQSQSESANTAPLYVLATNFSEKGSTNWINSHDVLAKTSIPGEKSYYIDGFKLKNKPVFDYYRKDAFKAIYNENKLGVIWFFNAQTVTCTQQLTELLLSQLDSLYKLNSLIKDTKKNYSSFEAAFKQEFSFFASTEKSDTALLLLVDFMATFKKMFEDENFGSLKSELALADCIGSFNESPALFFNKFENRHNSADEAIDWFMASVELMQKLRVLNARFNQTYQSDLFKNVSQILCTLQVMHM